MVRLSKEMYVNERAQQSALYETVKSDPYRLHYHLMPPAGWLNDPNGRGVAQGQDMASLSR